MNDQIVTYLRENPQGASSVELAEQFLRMKNPEPAMARVAIGAMLSKDQRCYQGDDKLWYATKHAAVSDTVPLTEVPWAAVSLVHDGPRLLHVAAWTILPSPEQLFARWLVNPAELSAEDRMAVSAEDDTTEGEHDTGEALASISEELNRHVPVFLSSQQRSLLAYHCSLAAEVLTDDILLLGELCRAADMPRPRPATIQAYSSALLGQAFVPPQAARQGKLLAECVAELISKLSAQGIESRADLEQRGVEDISSFDFSGKQFSQESLMALPQCPGVYGFKDRSDQYIYIGKAKNLRRRVSGYFRPTDESPKKLEKLRNEAISVDTYICGSEIESLLYEYRLIRKYSPPLNSQMAISERTGEYRPLSDCIVLLPHADTDKGMALWFRSHQKIALKPFDIRFSDSGTLAEELQRFFFDDKLPSSPSDFAEEEIAGRWIRRHADSLLIVPVHRLASGAEAAEAVRSYWSESQPYGAQ